MNVDFLGHHNALNLIIIRQELFILEQITFT